MFSYQGYFLYVSRIILNKFYIVNKAQIVIYSVCGKQRRAKSTFNARDKLSKEMYATIVNRKRDESYYRMEMEFACGSL